MKNVSVRLRSSYINDQNNVMRVHVRVYVESGPYTRTTRYSCYYDHNLYEIISSTIEIDKRKFIFNSWHAAANQ